MSNIPERNIAFKVDDDLFKEIKMRSLEKGMTLKGYFVSLAKADIANAGLDRVIENPNELIEKADRIIELLSYLKETQK